VQGAGPKAHGESYLAKKNKSFHPALNNLEDLAEKKPFSSGCQKFCLYGLPEYLPTFRGLSIYDRIFGNRYTCGHKKTNPGVRLVFFRRKELFTGLPVDIARSLPKTVFEAGYTFNHLILLIISMHAWSGDVGGSHFCNPAEYNILYRKTRCLGRYLITS
jgi:hypothetical protein